MRAPRTDFLQMGTPRLSAPSAPGSKEAVETKCPSMGPARLLPSAIDGTKGTRELGVLSKPQRRSAAVQVICDNKGNGLIRLGPLKLLH